MDFSEDGKTRQRFIYEMTDLSESLALCSVQTPPELARALVQALGDDHTDAWLEPCSGDGAFLRALSEYGIGKSRITAVDLNSTSRPADSLASTSRGIDFVAWSQNTERRFDKIIANPPFISLSKLDPALRVAALAVDGQFAGLIRPGSNYWCSFLCASLNLLRPGGGIAFVLPAAWDYANYAAPFRDKLTLCFARFEVHRTYSPMFDSVQEGSVVILADGYRIARQAHMERFEHESLVDLVNSISVKKKNQKPSVRATCGNSKHVHGVQILRDILSLPIGGVTGDAGYFLMTEEERQQRTLPEASVRPVLTRARHLVAAEITESKWQALRDQGERVWLFRPPPDLVGHPAVSSYLERPEDRNGCRRERFKIRQRNPWYWTPLPSRVDGFMSGMSRFGPWICFNGMSHLTATNTLYVVQFKPHLSEDERYGWAIGLLSSLARQYLQSCGRIYPDGLVKYEPGDLLGAPIPVPSQFDGAKPLYSKAIALLLRGREDEAMSIADKWLGRTAATTTLVRSNQ